MTRWVRVVTTALLATLIAGAATAQSPKLIGSYKDWDAFTYADQGKLVCYMASSPVDMEPKNVRRGDVYFMVAHREADKVSGEVSVYAGYPYRKDSTASVIIGGKKFELFTHGESAWVRESKNEQALVKSMIRGSAMEVRGLSSRGTKTTDRYSLLGFTAAYKSISRACGAS